MEEQLPAGLSEGQVAEFVEDDEVASDELVCGAALAPGTEFGLEVVDQVDDVVAPAACALSDAGPREGDGEISLALAALYNFHLNRRRDRDLREAETRSVAAAIYSEIILLRRQLALLARVVANVDQSDREFVDFRADLYRPSASVIFPRLAGKLGLLDPDLVVGISKFFANFEEATRSLDVLTAPHEGPKFACTIVLRPAVSGVQEVRPVLEKIQDMLGMTDIEEPDIGYARDLIEFWEETSGTSPRDSRSETDLSA